MVEVKSTKNVASTGIKILVYGEAGAGKTTLIKGLDKPLIISAEGGLLSIRDSDIPYIAISNLNELYEAYTYITQNLKSYKTIAIDSISEIAEVVLSNNKEGVKDVRQAYTSMLDEMLKLVRAFRDLPLNVYMTAKQERVQDDTGAFFYQPSTPGTKLSNELPYQFDEVFALLTRINSETGATERCLRTTLGGGYKAKDRSGTLNEFEPADLSKIMEKINGQGKH